MAPRIKPAPLLFALAVGIPLVVPGGVATAEAAPPQPAQVACTPTGTGRIDVSTESVWEDLLSTDIRDVLSGQHWTVDGASVSAPYDVTLTGLDPNRQYRLQFRYTDAGGTSAWSEPCAAAYPRPVVGNLVLNPSAEHGLDFWHGLNGALELVPGGSPGWGGAASIRVVRAAGTSYALTDSDATVPTVVSAAPGRYEAAAWVRAASPSAVGRPATIALTERTAAGATIRVTAGRAINLTATWQQVVVTARVRTAGDSLGVTVQQRRAAAGDAMGVDDVRVHRQDTLFTIGSPATARVVDPGVKRATAVDTTPCSDYDPFYLNCEREHDLTSFSAYVDGRAGGSGTARIRGLIYTDDGSGPGKLLATTRTAVVQAGQPAGWVRLPVREPVEIGSAVYWVGYQVGGPKKIVRFYGDDVSYCDCGYADRVWAGDGFADGPSDPFGAFHDATFNTMVRAAGGR